MTSSRGSAGARRRPGATPHPDRSQRQASPRRRWPLAVGGVVALGLGVVVVTPAGREAVSGWLEQRADDLTCGSGVERLYQDDVEDAWPVRTAEDGADLDGAAGVLAPELQVALVELGGAGSSAGGASVTVLAELDPSVVEAAAAGDTVVAADGALRSPGADTTIVVHPALLDTSGLLETPRPWAWRGAAYAGFDGADVVAVAWNEDSAEVATLAADSGKLIGCASIDLPDDSHTLLATTGMPLGDSEETLPTAVIVDDVAHIVSDRRTTHTFELEQAPVSAALAGDVLLLGEADGSLTAVSVEDGSLLWSVPDAGVELDRVSPVGDSLVALVPDAGSGAVLRVLDLSTGATQDHPVAGDLAGLSLSAELVVLVGADGGGAVFGG